MNILKDFTKGFYTLLFITPLFWFIPALIEGLQHYVEVQLGMFTVGDSVEAGRETIIRLAFGFLKTMSLSIPVILILKLSTNDWDKSKLFPLSAFEKKAIIYTILSLLAFLIFTHYFSQPLTNWLAETLSLSDNVIPFTPLIVLLIAMFSVRQYFLKGILRLSGIKLEGKLSGKSYLLEFIMLLFIVLLVTPPMVFHYKINGNWAVGTEGWELFSWLAVDSLLVGIMALLMGLSLRLAVTCVYSKELKDNGLNTKSE